MKRNLFFNFFVCLFMFSATSYLSAQPTWIGAKRGSPLFPQDMAIDNNGNTYVAWSVKSSACNIDGHIIETRGSMDNTDWAITSFDCSGSYRWTKVIGGNKGDAITGIGTDTLGGLYILGQINSDSTDVIYVDDDTTINYTRRLVTLMKYDTAGNFKWMVLPEPETGSTLGQGAVYSMTTEQNGSLHILSLLKSGIYCDGAFTATYPDSANTYILNYDKDGNFISGIHLDISNNSNTIKPYTSSAEIAYDPLYKRYYLCGMRLYDYHISFGGVPVSGQNFLTAFDETGNVLWMKQSDNHDAITALAGKPAIDPMGNIYVTGYSYNGWEGDPNDSYDGIGFNNTLGVYGFPILIKLDPDGVVQYASNASDNTDNSGVYITEDNGIVSILGMYGGKLNWGGLQVENTAAESELVNVFLARFNSETGTIIGLDTIRSSAAYDYPRFLRTDHKGNLYAGGQFGGTLYVADDVLYKNEGDYDAFIACFGYEHCGCEVPDALFTYTTEGDILNFTYTGSVADSVLWYFGDGFSGEGSSISHDFTASGDTVTVCAVSYNSCGNNMACMTFDKNNTSLHEVKIPESLLLYPSPASDYIIIKGDGIAVVSITDITGKILRTISLPDSGKINIADFVPGIYLARITNKNGNVAVKRFVVIK